MRLCRRTNKEHKMPGNPRDMITNAERRLPVRIRVGVPPGGFGQRYAQITAWLDENCGADGWAMTPSGLRGVLNDAVSIYFLDATLASAFKVARSHALGAARFGQSDYRSQGSPRRIRLRACCEKEFAAGAFRLHGHRHRRRSDLPCQSRRLSEL